ncbi:hypothetical protein Tco_1335768 [Tanacetum coccineum]
MMGKLDIDTLTIQQYLMWTQGNQALGIVKAGFGGMIEKDIEDMTTAEYMEYEAEMKRRRNARSYFPTKYEDKGMNSFHHDTSRVLDYLHHSDDSKFNAYTSINLGFVIQGQNGTATHSHIYVAKSTKIDNIY